MPFYNKGRNKLTGKCYRMYMLTIYSNVYGRCHFWTVLIDALERKSLRLRHRKILQSNSKHFPFLNDSLKYKKDKD